MIFWTPRPLLEERRSKSRSSLVCQNVLYMHSVLLFANQTATLGAGGEVVRALSKYEGKVQIAEVADLHV